MLVLWWDARANSATWKDIRYPPWPATDFSSSWYLNTSDTVHIRTAIPCSVVFRPGMNCRPLRSEQTYHQIRIIGSSLHLFLSRTQPHQSDHSFDLRRTNIYVTDISDWWFWNHRSFCECLIIEFSLVLVLVWPCVHHKGMNHNHTLIIHMNKTKHIFNRVCKRFEIGPIQCNPHNP